MSESEFVCQKVLTEHIDFTGTFLLGDKNASSKILIMLDCRYFKGDFCQFYDNSTLLICYPSLYASITCNKFCMICILCLCKLVNQDIY